MKRSIIIWTIALILVAVAVYTTYQYNNAPAPAPAETPDQTQNPAAAAPSETENQNVQVSIDAIDFKLKDLDGKEVSLSDYKGKTIYVNFWATWCPACKEELPFIQQLYSERKDTDLVVLTVDLQESPFTVSNFMAINKYNFPVLLDKDGDIATSYGVQSIPLSILIDENFKIVSARAGAMEDYEALQEFVDQLKKAK